MESPKAHIERVSPGPERASTTDKSPGGERAVGANDFSALQQAVGNHASPRVIDRVTSSPPFVLALQRTVGNQVTQRLIENRNAPTAAPPLVQRLRLTFAPPQKISDKNKQDYSAAEVFVEDQEADGRGDPVKIRVFPPEKKASRAVDLPRADWDALRPKGTREPDVSREHLLISGYQPINRPAFLNGGPSPQDVRQGLMGDCRIISALEALAVQQPGLITNAISPGGAAATYTIRLRRSKGPDDMSPNTQAPPEVFSITNALPVSRLAIQPDLLYALKGMQETSPGGFALWPALIEKAFATMWGGYERLTGALEKPVFFALGANVAADPSGNEGFLQINFMGDRGNPLEWKKTILAYWAKKYAMTTTAQGKQHNYSIIRVDPESVVVSDPNAPRGAAYQQRVANPAPYASAREQKPFGDDETASRLWPMSFTWEEFFGAFKWVYGAK